MKYERATAVLTIAFLVSLVLNLGLYFQIKHLEQDSARQIHELSQTLSDLVFSMHYQDIQAARQRWITVHGNPHDDTYVMPCYINTGIFAAWIDSKANLELVPEGCYGPRLYGTYWDGFPRPNWCRPPEIIALWVQLYNKSSDLWFSETDVLSRKPGDFACYLINNSNHEVIGIDAHYAIHLKQDFKDNSLSNILGTPNYLLSPRSYGMCNDGLWNWKYDVWLKDDEWYWAYDLEIIVDWKNESASIKMLKSK